MIYSNAVLFPVIHNLNLIHTHTYTHIYVCVCMCVSVYMCSFFGFFTLNKETTTLLCQAGNFLTRYLNATLSVMEESSEKESIDKHEEISKIFERKRYMISMKAVKAFEARKIEDSILIWALRKQESNSVPDTAWTCDMSTIGSVYPKPDLLVIWDPHVYSNNWSLVLQKCFSNLQVTRDNSVT